MRRGNVRLQSYVNNSTSSSNSIQLMNSSTKKFSFVATFLLILWGLEGVLSGDGFLNGIGGQIDATGDIISLIIKYALIFGGIWFVIQLIKGKEKN